MDFEGIAHYCMKKFKTRLHRPSSYYPKPTEEIQPLDYSTFTEWLEHGYGAGDVVEWDENIGLVQDGGVKEVKICLKIDRNGPNFDSFVLEVQLIHPAQENAVERIYEALEANGKEFGSPYFCITEKYTPKPDSIVTFQNRHTGEEGVGVLKRIQPSGEVIMYCWYVKGKSVRYSMDEELGNSADYYFHPVQPADYPRKALQTALGEVGKAWNHFLKRIEPLKMKVEKGGEYYYINDKKAVAKGVERETMTSHKRYLAGNYFKSREDAQRVADEEAEVRKRYLAEPESERKAGKGRR